MLSSLSVALFAASALAAEPSVRELEALVRKDLAVPVRPGGVDGSPFWNGKSQFFMYPPAFDFSPQKEAVSYRLYIKAENQECLKFDVKERTASLAPVWDRIATGLVTVWCYGVDAKGRESPVRGFRQRTFWKSAPYRPGTYPRSPRSFSEASRLAYEEIARRPSTRRFLKTGKPDPTYAHNCYPSKMHGALIGAMVSRAKKFPATAAESMKIALAAGNYLLSVSQPKDAPLAYFPPTYDVSGASFPMARKRVGQNMLVYPADVGKSFVRLSSASGDARFLTAARNIASTYLRLQGDDGTWYLMMNERDGTPVGTNRLQPMPVIEFLEDLYAATGDGTYREAADRAFRWVEKGPMRDWNWEGQFEDMELAPKYDDLSKYAPIATALYVLRRFPGDPNYLKFAREAVRFAEDQFVCWERPEHNGFGIRSLTDSPVNEQHHYTTWICPAVLEQYYYYVPVDASAATMIQAYLAIHAAEGNSLDMAKARTLGEALCRMQKDDGFIPTLWFGSYPTSGDRGWLNCLVADAAALDALSTANP